MNPLVSSALGSIIRFGLAWVARGLVDHQVWTQSDAALYVQAGTLAVLSLGWSAWSQHRGRLKLLTALWWARATESQVKAHIASGEPTPPISTSQHVVPMSTI